MNWIRRTIFFILILVAYNSRGQGNMITISGTVPAQMTICGNAALFTISIYNPSPFTLTNDTLKIKMPPGVIYQPGTISGATYLTTSAPNTAVFLLAPIATLTTTNISYSAAVNCDVMSYISGGGTIENQVRVNYTANNAIVTYDTYTTPFYIIRQPNLSITNVTNQSYTGNIGDVFSRCITIVNGGLGELSQFTLTDVHGSGIQINAVSQGTLVNSGLTETISFTAADFVSVGDGDTLFENGESISVCETVTVINCSALSSAFTAFWGCNIQSCQSSVSSANVLSPNSTPNLVIVPNNGNIYEPMNACINQATPQQLMITNTGVGVATNILIDIFQSLGGGYNPSDIGSHIDTSSFTIQTTGAPIPVHFSPSGAVSLSAMVCMAPSSMGRAYLAIPDINPGDTVYIKWNSYSCCWDACGGSGRSYIHSWRYNCNYENICGNPYLVPENWGRVYSNISGAATTNSYPASLNSGQSATVNFLFTNYSFSYPVGASAHWKFEFVLPACLSYTGNLKIVNYNGTNTWSPTSVTTTGNVVTGIFNGTVPFDLTSAEIMLDISASCTACGGVGNVGPVGINAFYVPDTLCACEIGVFCTATPPISVNCPGGCSEGLIFTGSSMLRTSYGLPDNEAGGGDGLPDNTGALDLSKIRRDRAMFGDTISVFMNGYVQAGQTYSSWQYCYVSSSVSNGIYLSFLDASLEIYRTGSLIATCSNFIPVVSDVSTTRTFSYDLSVPALLACLPQGFIYSDTDSLVFKPRYKVTGNVGGGPLSCNAVNQFYLSDIANPVSSANKFQCGGGNNNFFLIGYYFINLQANNYTVRSCDLISVSQNYGLGIGQCCNNYAGGNLFPYEYRYWAHIDTLTSIVPPYYEFVSARFNNIRTSGTLASITSPWIPLLPVNSNSDTLIFPVENYYQNFGGTDLVLGDDGFYGTLEITLRTSCLTEPIISQPIQNDWTYSTTNYLTGAGSYPNVISVVQDNIVYDAPSLQLQSTLPSINAPNALASWDITIFNQSNVSNALNAWIAGPQLSGVSITQVLDLDNNITIPLTDSIYQVGFVNAGSGRHFRISATYTSCFMDSIIIYSGWNCNVGYPSGIGSYPCTTKSITLKLTPLMPMLVPQVAGPDSIQLCDTASYMVESVNVQLGSAYNVFLSVVLPSGASIVPGMSQLSYPISSPFVSIPDPVFAGGTTWQWDISSINSLMDTNGLKGILEPLLNKFRVDFKIVTNCGYTSGSRVGASVIGQAACGTSTGQEVALSDKLGIIGASIPYDTDIILRSTYISPCANTSAMYVSIFNRGPMAFGNADSLVVQLPAGVTFVSNSFVPVYNPPPTGSPAQYILNGVEYLKWPLPQNTNAGDSVLFSFSYQGDPQQLSCDISEFRAQTTSPVNVNCMLTGNNCEIDIVTGDTVLPVFTYKAYLSLSNGNATSVFNPPSGETVTINLDITNTGEAILSGENSIIEFFYDSNGNNIYNAGDIFIADDTLIVTNNSTVPYSATLNVAAGQACAILAVIRSTENPCVCDPSELLIIPVLLTQDTVLCSGEAVELNTPPVSGYSYSWSPANGISDSTISNPLVTLTANTIPVIATYSLTINRIGCTSVNTIQVTVNPIPVSVAGADTVGCLANAMYTLGASPVVGYSYSWAPASGLSNDTVSNPQVSLNIPLDTAYVVTTTNSLGCSSADSVTIVVYPLPVATISGNSTVCKDAAMQAIVLHGANGTAPYTITYTLNSGVNQTITTGNGDSVVISVSTNIPDTFSYSLVSIKDSGPSSCAQIQTGSAVVTVNPIPVSNAGADIFTCSVNIPDTLGATAMPGYSYSWSPGIGLNDTAVANPLVALITPDTIRYLVTTSALGCSSSDSVTVVVNSLPLATIAGTVMVCQNPGSQNIIFKGSSGVPPYTITYTVNGGINQTVVTSSGDSAVVAVPLDTVGTFTYSLVSIVDANVLACSQAQVGSAIITVAPLPEANFNASEVCLDQEVVFTNTSSISGGSLDSVYWYFGDSGTSDTAYAPVHSYASAGIYSSSLFVISNTGCRDTVTKNVVVHPLPVADFTVVAPTGSCNDSTVEFNNISTVQLPDTLETWYWNFGDLSPVDSNYSTSHVYPLAGAYTIGLVVSSSFGCLDTVSKSIVISPNPVADFTGTPVSGCEPLCVTFGDSSLISTGSIAQWLWNVGDGSTPSTAPYFEHCYTNDSVDAVNSLNITLTVTSDSGCVSTVTKNNYINVYPYPDADFAVEPETTTVINPIASFIDLTSGAHFWNWDFGDTNTSNQAGSQSHTYAADIGSYLITLITTTQYGCSDTAYRNFYIEGDFSFFIPNSFTPNDDGVNDFFFGKSVGVAKYDLWIFDRWGNMVYHGNDVPTENARWNGKANYGKEIAQRDVYVWKVELTDVFNKAHTYTGTVTLVR